MILASIFITSSSRDGPPDLPPIVRENIASLKQFHPDLPHRLFLKEDIEALLEERFSADVLHAFRSLRPNAYKADLARYCILYEFGGIYADLSYLLVEALPLGGGSPIIFRDFLISSPWDTSIGLIRAPARHKALGRAIELVIANVAKAYYGATCLCPTGPALFGKALAATCEAEELVTGAAFLGDRELLQASFPHHSLPDKEAIHCLRLGERLIAIKRKRMGSPGVADLGLANENLYYEMWSRREIYAASASMV
jgi:mannosyltransferase OCH1-like enzyme